MVSELAREHVASSSTVTVCSSHLVCCLASNLFDERNKEILVFCLIVDGGKMLKL